MINLMKQCLEISPKGEVSLLTFRPRLFIMDSYQYFNIFFLPWVLVCNMIQSLPALFKCIGPVKQMFSA